MPLNDAAPAPRSSSKKTAGKKTTKKKTAAKAVSKKERVRKVKATHTDDEGKQSDVVNEEERDLVKVEAPSCNVGLGLARTINLGNYESVRVEVSLHAPCPPEEVDDCFQDEFEWVTEKLAECMDRLGVEVE